MVINMNRRTLISNLAWRIHEIANCQAVKQYELKYAILDAEPASRDDDFDCYYEELNNGIKNTSSMYDFAAAFVKLSDMDDYSLYNIAKDKPLTLSELQLVLNWTMFRASEALEEERRQYKQTSIQAVVDFSEEYPELDMYFDIVVSNNKLKLIEK